MIHTIVCTGDSHTWGQGASPEVQNALNPPVMAGDLRPLPFDGGDYVSNLRQTVSQKTGSSYGEISAEQLAVSGLFENCAPIKGNTIKVNKPANLFRIFFKCRLHPSTAAIYLDGQPVKTIYLQVEDATNAYVQIPVFAEENAGHLLEIRALAGTVLIYRIEWYCGTHAVINSGIGSCPSGRYGEVYWDSYVAAYHPSLLIMEAHTINDWLTGHSPELYRQQLSDLLRKGKDAGAGVLLVTVPQILGEQKLPNTAARYNLFVEASRQAAKDENIPVADVNEAFGHVFASSSPEHREQALFADPWHVSASGHQVYAHTIWEAVIRNFEISI